MARVDFDRIAPAYDAGRDLSDQALELWRRPLLRHLPEPISLPALDLGCGTGRFTVAIAGWLGKTVVGIDPSTQMLRAARDTAGPGVDYLLGRAENIPLAESTCDFAWLSTVIHHFDDLGRVAAELRRVARPGGAVFIRSWFPGRPDVPHFQYFPRAKQIAESFPSIETVEAAFARAGFRRRALESVTQVEARSLSEACERLRHRADTTLLLLSDEEFEEGMRRLEADAAAEVDPKPLTATLDLLVLR